MFCATYTKYSYHTHHLLRNHFIPNTPTQYLFRLPSFPPHIYISSIIPIRTITKTMEMGTGSLRRGGGGQDTSRNCRRSEGKGPREARVTPTPEMRHTREPPTTIEPPLPRTRTEAKRRTFASIPCHRWCGWFWYGSNYKVYGS